MSFLLLFFFFYFMSSLKKISVLSWLIKDMFLFPSSPSIVNLNYAMDLDLPML